MDPNEEYASETTKAERDEEEKKQALRVVRVREIIETEGFSETINFLLDISNFNGNNYSTDTKDMVYMEGRRSIFHDVLSFLDECDPTYYARLILKRAKEAQDERQRERNRSN